MIKPNSAVGYHHLDILFGALGGSNVDRCGWSLIGSGLGSRVRSFITGSVNLTDRFCALTLVPSNAALADVLASLGAIDELYTSPRF